MPSWRLRPTFVPARRVGLVVKLPSAFALEGQSPSVRALRGPFPSTRGPGRTHLWCTSYRAHSKRWVYEPDGDPNGTQKHYCSKYKDCSWRLIITD
ncbi:hypothetical protein BVC80_8495g3 [Macleaya cordata]|uniref:Uncharacterized protein n=1 Tax=Macleaya cordata TaxID=56857 RepID=A0A200QXY0_MACCD|nr:hypothetical protein BVC80_8495g3 [Macleaya cordata]